MLNVRKSNYRQGLVPKSLVIGTLVIRYINVKNIDLLKKISMHKITNNFFWCTTVKVVIYIRLQDIDIKNVDINIRSISMIIILTLKRNCQQYRWSYVAKQKFKRLSISKWEQYFKHLSIKMLNIDVSSFLKIIFYLYYILFSSKLTHRYIKSGFLRYRFPKYCR